MWTRTFWRQAIERAIKSFAQVLVLMWSSETIFNVFDVAWLAVLGVSLGAALLSVLTSIVSAPLGEVDSPSLASTGGR